VSAPKQHTLKSPNGKYNYLLFDSRFAFNAFVDEEIKQLSSTNTSLDGIGLNKAQATN
jgi:hypothetical protein